MNIVKTGGKVYVKAPPSFWAKTLGPAGAKLADKWLVQDAAAAGASVTSLTLQGIAAALNATDSPLKPEVVRGQEQGQKVVTLTQQDGSTIAVANSGQPLPLRITNNGAQQGSLTFTDYAKPVSVAAPPGAVTAQQAAQAPTTGTA